MIIAVFLYRINDALTKILIGDVPIFELMAVRSFVTVAVIAFLFSKIKIKWIYLFDKWLLLRNFLAGIALLFEVAALKTISLSTFVLIAYTAPVIAKLMACYFFKETFSRKDVLTSLLCFMGVGFIVSSDSVSGDFFGVLYALCGAFLYALSMVATKVLSKEIPANTVFATYIILLLLICVPSSFISESPNYFNYFSAITALIPFVFIAVFHSIAFLLTLKAIQNANMSIVFLEYLGVVVSLIFDYLLWHKLPGQMELLGGACILIATIAVPLVSYKQNKQNLII